MQITQVLITDLLFYISNCDVIIYLYEFWLGAEFAKAEMNFNSTMSARRIRIDIVYSIKNTFRVIRLTLSCIIFMCYIHFTDFYRFCLWYLQFLYLYSVSQAHLYSVFYLKLVLYIATTAFITVISSWQLYRDIDLCPDIVSFIHINQYM